jgi:hypothetical protein
MIIYIFIFIIILFSLLSHPMRSPPTDWVEGEGWGTVKKEERSADSGPSDRPNPTTSS